eukprot:10547228-Alexandrium_andersonii.AAC.1
MTIRQNRRDRGLFWGCSLFPSCRGTLPMALGQAAAQVPPAPQAQPQAQPAGQPADFDAARQEELLAREAA